MVSRTQVTLDSELQRRARRRAAELGVSFAEYVRRLVALDLDRPRQVRDPSAVFGLGSSDGSDIARDKDAMVGEAVAARRLRRRGR
jgi:hypothetical protein